ncbi:MAG TPA: hypothetical protein IAC48_10125 [Candidatus Limiplasma stercoravium]|nr:hypothetical protein [Candidatus Limiplasma stercoravium]
MWLSFCAGAIGYPVLEMLWRGRTHPSMALAGGLSMALLHGLERRRQSLWRTALAGGLAITGVEYVLGRLFNREYDIWDYRGLPLNLRGQVCAPYALAWCGLSALTIMGMRLRKCLHGRPKAAAWPLPRRAQRKGT